MISEQNIPSIKACDIELALKQTLNPSVLEIRDDSHLHAGHAGAKEGRHFHVHIVSDRFTGMGRVARHRLIYDALRALISQGIHALAIDAHAPHEK